MKVLFIFFLFIIYSFCFICDGTSFTIKDDPSLDQIIIEARNEFLQTRPTNVSVLDVTLLLPESSNGNIIWKRGTYNPFELGYPASTVKLAYMAASIKWCHDQNRPSNCIDQHVRPMIKNSDNLQTGIVVDICSGAPNINISSTSNPLFTPWYNKRLWTMNYLNDHNLLGNQTINVKTYPTNTGQTLWGAEYVSWDTYGRNAMCSQCAASLMLEVTKGGLYGIPTNNSDLYEGPTGYMRGLLSHEMWSGESSFGFGIPPGSVLLNKIGVAYDNLNDIALIKLPSGKEFILSVYSTGYEPNQPYPYDGSNLGVFIYFLINKLQLLQQGTCNPPILTFDVTSSYFGYTGNWIQSSANDALNSIYYQSTDDSIAYWNIEIPSTGLYEIAIWSPQSSLFSSNTQINIKSVTGNNIYTINQQVYGGRWYKLSDFYLTKGNHEKMITIIGTKSINVVNAIKISKWPECNKSPGATCQDYDPSGSIC